MRAGLEEAVRAQRAAPGDDVALCMAAHRPWNARLTLGFERDGHGRTDLIRREHIGPLRVQKALYPEGPGICHAVVVHPPGGIAGGDDLAIDLTLGSGSHALITTPGATKWYRSAGASAYQRIKATVRADAVLEWLPQETIVFDGARAVNRVEIDLEANALFLGWDIICFGRTAAGESFRHGSFRQRWQIARGRVPLWIEAGDLAGDSPLLSSAVGLGGQSVCATFLAAGRPIPPPLLEALRTSLADLPFGDRVAVTRMSDLIVARYVGPSTEEARTAGVALWSVLRPQLAGAQARMPRLWAT